jgi:hypothetical protein
MRMSAWSVTYLQNLARGHSPIHHVVGGFGVAWAVGAAALCGLRPPMIAVGVPGAFVDPAQGGPLPLRDEAGRQPYCLILPSKASQRASDSAIVVIYTIRACSRICGTY